MKHQKNLPEQAELEQLAQEYRNFIELETLGVAKSKNSEYPVYGVKLGSKDPKAPVFALVGGVHGLERIGSHVLISFLKSILAQTKWDKSWQDLFQHVRLIAIPILNPTGFANMRRSNGSGVDLMRNSPLDSTGTLIPLVSGHRHGPWLPWYRGELGAKMEDENLYLKSFFERETFNSDVVISLDLHSGFGLKDRIWYPWSTSHLPFPYEDKIQKLKELFIEAFPYHIYKIENQTVNYSNHGDLWDWMYLEYKKSKPNGIFLPFTLEMGSWMWVKKNPWQFFTVDGLFNPIKKHRYARTMRRHHNLLEFLLKASTFHEAWT